ITASTDYQVLATCTNTGGGTATSNTTTVNVALPSTSPSTSTVCATNGQPLTVTIPLGGSPVNILTENFNGGTLGAFTQVNTTTGGTNNAGAAWTVQPSGHNPGQVLTPPTATNFVITNSDVTSTTTGPVVHTELISPVINTTGYNTLNLNFSHYFRALTTSTAKVEVTTDGTNWTAVQTYPGTSSVGTNSAFANASINLNTYVNQPNFQFRLVYDAGWDWWWAVDDIALSGIPTQTVVWSATGGAGNGLPTGALTPSITNNNITVTPTTAGTYTYTATTSACGSAPAVTIVATPAPAANFALAIDSVCENTPVTINFAGDPNVVITFTDGTNNFTALTDGLGNASWTSAPLSVGPHTYSLVTVQGTSCTVNATGSMTVEATPRPTAILTAVTPGTICNGTSATVSVAAITSSTWPVTVYLNNGTSQSTVSTINNSDNFTVSPPTGSYTYTIDSVMDAQGCASIPGGTPGTAPLTVNPSPSATISASSASVCSGDLVTYTVNLTGSGPWDFEYTDGTTPVQVTAQTTTPFTFTANPTVNTTYSFNSLSDASGCAALPIDYSSTATVTIGAPATVTDPATTSVLCTGSGTSFTVTSTGLNVNYAWLENGSLVTNGGVYSGANSNTLVISDVDGLDGNTYQAIAIGQCGDPDTSNAATLNMTSINQWTGATSNLWSVPTNWGCGTVPVITTDVVIPTVAMTMPVVDIPNAVANSLELQTGTSLMFQSIGTALELDSIITLATGANFDASSGNVILSGANAQNIPAGMYFDLEVRGGGTKTLDGNIMVDNTLTLDSGWVVINNFNLTLGAPEQTVGGNELSFIVTNGTGVVEGLSIAPLDSVMFHVGANTSEYNPLGLSNAGVTDDFTVRTLNNVYEDGTGTSSTLVSFPVIDNTWLVEEGTPGGSMVRLKPYYYISQGINGFDNNWVYGLHHDGMVWEAMIDSADQGTIPNGLNPYHIVLDSIQSFSPFGVGSGTQFPLSVKISDIAAINVGTRNKIDWRSSTEAMGDKYELQRSADAKSFTTIATINAKGDASAYAYWDAEPVTGANYYRVKLVDANGNYGYTKVVTATVKGTNFSVEAYPNPVGDVLTVKANGAMGTNAMLEITDATGKAIRTVKFESNSLNVNMSDLAAGVYFIKYSDDANHESIKITKQ
ncbi:MAG: T9SS type A sorting domain-containing protein, partial [Flavipsychrobacter sp.]|nr:T9SS type A sorting domain-containing protein [Flavipsychrobacter sp.]